MERTRHHNWTMLLSCFIILSSLLSSCGSAPTPTPIVVVPNQVSGNLPSQSYVNILISSVGFNGSVSNLGDTGNLQLIMVTSDDSGHADALTCPYGTTIQVHKGDTLNPCRAGLAYPADVLQGNLYVILIAMDVKDNSAVTGVTVDAVASALAFGLVQLIKAGADIGEKNVEAPEVAVGAFVVDKVISLVGSKVKDYLQNNYMIGGQTFIVPGNSNWNNGQQISANSTNGQVTFNFTIRASSTAAGQIVEAAPAAPTAIIPPATEVSNNMANSSEEEHFSDPADFARWYFTAVWQDRNYNYLWTLSTPSFQSAASTGGYSEFTSWWSSVDKVDISSISVAQNDGNYASIHVVVTFHLHDGRLLLNRKYDYDLVYSSDRQTWMFDYR